MNRGYIAVTVAFGCAFFACSPRASFGADWGYEDQVVPQRAVALPLGGAKKAAPAAVAKPPAAKPVTKPVIKPGAKLTPQGPSVAAEKQNLVSECWSQIYGMAAAKKLTDEQKRKLAAIVNKNSARQSVTQFWPKITDYLAAHPAQEENYSKLLRALLRWRARNLALNNADEKTAPPAVTQEIALINEVLGPERVAVDGKPAFSEESVEAYADMACFLYEQNNPNKTIDAFDNRAMFASVVCEKYRNAPSDKDKQAMAAFDLAWAKFKCAWEGASETTRAGMLSALQKQGANSAGAAAQDPVLKSLLDNWRL